MQEQEKFESRLPELEIHPEEEIGKDQALVFIAANVNQWTEIMTVGNISTIIGKAKSKKTFFITMLAAGVITNRNFFIRSKLNGGNMVIFDTEQGKYHVWKVARRIQRMVGSWPRNLRIFALRPLSVRERIREIENYIYLHEIDIVIIDGIRDLVTDINDAEQATDIVGKLMKWSYERELHICTVLHQNKADDNARGHIGTEIVNKSETVILVAKTKADKELAVITSVYTRGEEIREFQFKIENGLPEVITPENVQHYEPEREEEEVPF